MFEPRAVLYLTGVIFSIVNAARLFPVRNKLAKLMGVTWLVWGINCAVLLTIVTYWSMSGTTAPWQPNLMTLNAALLAFMPVMHAVLFARIRNHDAGGDR